MKSTPGEFSGAIPNIRTMATGQEIWKRLGIQHLEKHEQSVQIDLAERSDGLYSDPSYTVDTYYPKISKSFAYQNSEKIIHKRINDLLLTTLANDPIHFGINDGGGTIQFGQAMLIRNEGTKDVSIQPISSHENVPRKYLCKKGVSYVVVRLSKLEEAETGQELLLLEKDTLWTIPPVRAISDFYR